MRMLFLLHALYTVPWAIFECRKDCCCFTDCISSCTAICWVNPHGFQELLACLYRWLTAWPPGPTGSRTMHRTTAPTQPSIRQWAISGVLPCLLIRTQILQIRDCQEQRRTLRARRHALRIHELIRLHVRLPESYGILPESKNTLRSAPHSVIAIFRYRQRLYSRNLMKNPG